MYLCEQLECAFGGLASAAEVTRHTLFEASRLAHVDHVAVASQESIDARFVGNRSTSLLRKRVAASFATGYLSGLSDPLHELSPALDSQRSQTWTSSRQMNALAST